MINLLEARQGWADGLRPTAILEVADWADDCRLLNEKNAAEPGKWRTERTPYLRQIMNDLSNHSPVNFVDLMAGAQVGKTELGNNWIGYTIAHAPGPGMLVQPTVELAKLWSRQRLAPMIEDMECLKEKIALARSRDSGNTVLLKEYAGGLLRMAGANSAAGLRSMPVKNLMLDEIDAYPPDVNGEGDPVELAINRTKTFPRKKVFCASTPTTEDLSRIERRFKKGTMSYYFVPCPHCEAMQKIELGNLKWKKNDAGEHLPATAELACIGCGALISERFKTQMLARGEWRDTVENEKHKSYQISSLYSPIGWESWADIVAKFLDSKDNTELLKTFTNTVEGLPYKETGQEIDEHFLKKRAEKYDLKICPRGCLALTAGVDVQDNRLEVVVIGHGAIERWPIDHNVIWGSPGESGTWQILDDYLKVPFDHVAGSELSISATAIDSGGHHTSQVYDFCRLRKSRHIIAVKGHSVKGKPILGKPTPVDVNIHGKVLKSGGEVWMVGTDTAKNLIYAQLKLTEPAADGYWHFSQDLPDDFYKQLTAERIGRRYVKGFPVSDWVLPPGARNEILDCVVYSIAAFHLLGLHRWRAAQWRQLETRVQPEADLFATAAVADRDAARNEQAEQVAPRRKRARRRATARRIPKASFSEHLRN